MEEKMIKQTKPVELDTANSPSRQTEDRLSFLKKLGSGIFASLVAPAVLTKGFNLNASPVDNIKLPVLPAETEDEDIIVHLMRDVARALAKPVEERSWSMVIDLRKCVGCHSCTVSCVAENKLPPGVVYRPVLDEELGTYPNVRARHTPRPCMQCDVPSCVDVCPVNATWKRADGITKIDYDKCIGCRYCITACPYSARTFDSGHYHAEEATKNDAIYQSDATMNNYEDSPAFEYGQNRARKDNNAPIGNARKCHFCLHRVEKGLVPQCVVSCIGRATFFGDANDPKSMVAKMIAQPNVMRLKEELGTKPKVYYLM